MPDDHAQIKSVRSFQNFKGQPSKSSPIQLRNWVERYNGSVSVEIGCGAGLHPIKWAKLHPDRGIIAIERTQNKFSSFESRIKGHNLSNIYPVNQDALYWLPQNLGTLEVSEYFFLYPNPYPKEKQANKRWHRNPFFHFLLDRLKPGGVIHFASNELDYIRECEAYCKQFWGLTLIEKEIVTSPPYTDFKTHFEKKYLLAGQSCVYLTYQKS